MVSYLDFVLFPFSVCATSPTLHQTERVRGIEKMSERTVDKNYITHKELKDTYERMCQKRIDDGWTDEDTVVSGDELFEELGLD